MNTLQSLQWEKFGEKKLENQKEYYVTTPENEVVIAIYFAKVPTVWLDIFKLKNSSKTYRQHADNPWIEYIAEVPENL